MQSMRSGREGDLRVDHAGLDHGETLDGIEFQNPIEAVECDDQTTSDRQGAARQTGAAATGDEGNLFVATKADQRDDLVCRLGHDDGQGAGPEGGQAVAFVGGELLGLRQQTIRWKQPGEARKDVRHQVSGTRSRTDQIWTEGNEGNQDGPAFVLLRYLRLLL